MCTLTQIHRPMDDLDRIKSALDHAKRQGLIIDWWQADGGQVKYRLAGAGQPAGHVTTDWAGAKRFLAEIDPAAFGR